MTNSETTRRRRVARAILYGIVFLGLLGVAFGAGLYAGAERTVVFELVRNVRTRIQTALGAPPPPQATSTRRSNADVVHRTPDAIAHAQAQNKPPANYLAWAGFYRIATSEKDLSGLKPENPWLPNVIIPRLQPWARARMEATDGVAEDTGQICQPTGMFRTTGFSGSFLWLPSVEKIVIAYGAIETAGVQRVYLNRTHPRNLRPSWNGDSIGYWEGNTLVVDSIGFNASSWLHPTMEPHSEEVHMVQRIQQVRGGEFLEIQYTVEDWKALTAAYTYSRYYRKLEGSMPEDICNDDLQIWRDFRNQALARQRDRSRKLE